MLFDSHAHYDDEKFYGDRDNAIKGAFESGIGYILNASSDIETSQRSIELAERYDNIYASVGIHPHNVEEAAGSAAEDLVRLAGNKKVVAIGEIGLDYYYDFAPRALQKDWFARQIELARQLRMPIIIHNRDSHQDIMDIIKSSGARDVGGVFHCYSGSVEMAKELLDLNFYISIGGIVTFKNARKIIEVVEYLPEDRLLLETDCPYLAPEPYRGRRNDSSYMVETARKVAQIRNVTLEHIARITTCNAKQLFRIQ